MPRTIRAAIGLLLSGAALAVGTPVAVGLAAPELARAVSHPAILVMQTLPYALAAALWLPARVSPSTRLAAALPAALLLAAVVLYLPMLWAPSAVGGDMAGLTFTAIALVESAVVVVASAVGWIAGRVWPRNDASERGAVALGVLLLAVALALRVLLLDQKNMWLDEVASWDVATHDLAYLFRTTAADVHPPLYYLLLKGWIGLAGESAAAIRALSVAAGLLSVGFAWALARRTLPGVVAAAATLWIVVSPHAVFFAQEARMYAPAAAAVLGFCLAYRIWVDSEYTSRMALVGYVVGAAGALYLHYFTALAVAAVWVHVAWLHSVSARPFPWRWWMAAHAAIAALFLPWIAVAADQLSRGQPWRAPVGPADLPDHLFNLFKGLAAGDYGHGVSAVVLAAAMATGLVVGLTQIVGHRSAHRVDERHVFLVVMAVAPIVVAVAALPISGELFLHRYLAFSQPLVVLAVASALTRVGASAARPGPRSATVALPLLACSALSLVPLAAYYAAPSKDSDPRPIVARLMAGESSGDPSAEPVFVAPGFMEMTLRFISEDVPALRRVDTPADLERVFAAGGEEGGHYLVVDYRWPGAATLRADPRLQRVPVSAATDEGLALYRVRPR